MRTCQAAFRDIPSLDENDSSDFIIIILIFYLWIFIFTDIKHI